MLSSRALLRTLARCALYPLVESLTLRALLARKRMARERRGVRRLLASGGQRVLVVAAHPDDETIGCAGAILTHLRGGDSVHVVMVTDGSGSRAGGLAPEEMARVRTQEVDAVAELYGGATIHQLGLRENRWQVEELEPVLADELASGRYDIVYAPSCVDFHPEHMKVARTLSRALCGLSASAQPRVRIYEMQVPLGMELVDTIVPLEGLRRKKGQAIVMYASQRGALDLWQREARYLGALYGCRGGAEAYWEVSAEAYGRVIAHGVWSWRDTPFASLTGRPLDDLRAHVKGSTMRRELCAIAEGSVEL
jgi:LmbE family N-acetylglucosaminyl deacetylase